MILYMSEIMSSLRLVAGDTAYRSFFISLVILFSSKIYSTVFYT